MPKSLAELVNDDMAGPSAGSDAMGADDYDQSMQACAQDAIDAFKKGDASGVDMALRNWHDLAHKAMGDSGPDSSAGHVVIAAMPHGGK